MQFCQIWSSMKMVKTPVIHEVLAKQYLRSILDISAISDHHSTTRASREFLIQCDSIHDTQMDLMTDWQVIVQSVFPVSQKQEFVKQRNLRSRFFSYLALFSPRSFPSFTIYLEYCLLHWVMSLRGMGPYYCWLLTTSLEHLLLSPLSVK